MEVHFDVGRIQLRDNIRSCYGTSRNGQVVPQDQAARHSPPFRSLGCGGGSRGSDIGLVGHRSEGGRGLNPLALGNDGTIYGGLSSYYALNG